MKKRIGALLLSLTLLLTGCSGMDGSYVYVEPHVEQGSAAQTGSVSATNYLELIAVLEQLVRAGTETCTIDIGDFDKEEPAGYINAACHHIRTASPMGAYAVEDITYEMGSVGSGAAVAVEITYLHEYREIQAVQRVADMDQIGRASCRERV